MKVYLAAAAIAALAAGAAYANHHEGEGKMKHGDWEAKIATHFAETDADGNGEVTEEEMVAQARAKFAEMKGDDEVITLEEVKAHHKAKMEAMESMDDDSMDDDNQ